MSIYIQADKFKGNVTAKGFEQAVECESMDIDMARHVHTHTGVANDRSTGLPRMSALRITKRADNSSVPFAQALLKAQNVPQLTVSLVRNHSDGVRVYNKYTFKNVLVSGYHEAADRLSGEPLEVITLNFTSMEKRFTPRNADNTDGSPVSIGYDITTGKAA